MSIWTAATDPLGRRQCKRCHKFFLPRKDGQEYGPKCARKVAAQEAMWQHIEELHPEIKTTAADDVTAEESAVAAYRGAVLA